MGNCPMAKGFRLIQGKCYAFETDLRTFDATQTRCGQIFPNNTEGKIFEPTSDKVLEEVLKQAKIECGGANPQIWLGITDKTSENNFVYHSDGQPQKLNWAFGRTNNGTINCLLVHHSYVTSYRTMLHWDCSKSLAAICELESEPSHEERIANLEKSDQEKTEALQVIESNFNCPMAKGFRLIQGKCYAFETDLRTFDATQTRCGQIFPNNTEGKIFEPTSDKVL